MAVTNKGKAAIIAVTQLVSLQPLAAIAAGNNSLGVQHMRYQESDERMQVDYTQVAAAMDIGTDFTLSGNASVDVMTGATPALDAKTGASKLAAGDSELLGDGFTQADAYKTHLIDMEDERTAVSAALTWRTAARHEWTGGISHSEEEDYKSKGFSIEHLHHLDQYRNRSLSIGFSHLKNDVLFYRNRLWKGAEYNTLELGITQVLSPRALIKAATFAMWEKGALSNPYKRIVRKINVGDAQTTVFRYYLSPDKRPDKRQVAGLDLKAVYRINMQEAPLTLHANYRFYNDDWGVQAHTLETKGYLGERSHTFGQWFAVLRYYQQSAASFYKTANTIAVFDGKDFGSVDERLSDFDSTTIGLGWERQFAEHWAVNLRINHQSQSYGLDMLWSWAGINYEF